MPKRTSRLMDSEIERLKPKEKDYRVSAGDGLSLMVTTTGGKLWRFSYRFEGKRPEIALGAFPAVLEEDAWRKKNEAKRLLAQGINPAAHKKERVLAAAQDAENTFENVARKWHASVVTPKGGKPRWNEKTATQRLKWLEENVFSELGNRPIKEIKAPELAVLLENIATRTAGVARRVKYLCNDVFDYAIVRGMMETANPVAALKKVLPPMEDRHHPALVKPKDVAGLLRAMDSFTGTFIVSMALQFSALTFVRPGELRTARWQDLELDEPEGPQWGIRDVDMKKDEAHIVPLSKQALNIIERLRPVTGKGCYLFPTQRTLHLQIGSKTPQRPMSENTINAALRRMGFGEDEMVAHGFRVMARTMLDERLRMPPDWIEKQLAHGVPDRLGNTYNRTLHLDDRRVMMQKWADYLDSLRGLGAAPPHEEEKPVEKGRRVLRLVR